MLCSSLIRKSGGHGQVILPLLLFLAGAIAENKKQAVRWEGKKERGVTC
jgi:uncharacterized membrane protein